MEAKQTKELKVQIAAMLEPVAGAHREVEAVQILAAAAALRPGDGRELALDWARQRAQGAPLGLVMGHERFLGIELMAREDVLVAREETELLGREVLAVLNRLSREQPDRELWMIDMGCGSGNLTCACALAVPQARIWASDLMASCVQLTRDNLALHGLEGRAKVIQGDLFGPLQGQGLEASMDLVMMNPPYIPSKSLETSHAGLLEHEPRAAFDGGPYGISILIRLLHEAPPFLKPGGHLLFEFGAGQAKMVRMLAERNESLTGLRFALNWEGEARAAILRKRLDL